jgi:HK97 gp10 family phage protein
MTDSVEINIHGLAETQRRLYQFSERLGDRVTLLALRAGAKFLLKKIREVEPVRTGRLRKATVVANSRINRRRLNGKVGVYITVKPGRSRADQRGAYYAGFVERGYKKGNTTVTGRKFVKSTFEANKQAALDIVLAALEQGGQTLISEIERR